MDFDELLAYRSDHLEYHPSGSTDDVDLPEESLLDEEESDDEGEEHSAVSGKEIKLNQQGVEDKVQRLQKLRRDRLRERRDYEHVNPYAENCALLDHPHATWVMFNEPGMDDRLDAAGPSLDKMFEKFKIYPVFISSDVKSEKLFFARYEFPQYQREFKHVDGPVLDGSIGFIHFLIGIPFGAIEVMGMIGEISSDPKDVVIIQAHGRAAAPIPKGEDLFEGFEEKRMVYGKMWLSAGYDEQVPYAKAIAESLGKPYPEPKAPLWWMMVDFGIGEDLQFPVPGEFLAIAPRMFPNLPWSAPSATGGAAKARRSRAKGTGGSDASGEGQDTSPFLFGGNWMETVYYTNARVLEVLDIGPYPTYIVQYRKYVIIAKPTDYAEHKVDDRVTVLRVNEKDRDSWTWEDLAGFNTARWVIAPISFYEAEKL